MKNYGDSLSNCNDNEENTIDTNDKISLPDKTTPSQVNYIIILLIIKN